MSIQNSPLAEKSLQFAIEIVTRMRPVKGCGIIKDQILRAGTSIGANATEAQRAQSKPDFISKMSIALKEAYEVDYWLRLLHATDYIEENAYKSMRDDNEELISLLIAICKTAAK